MKSYQDRDNRKRSWKKKKIKIDDSHPMNSYLKYG